MARWRVVVLLLALGLAGSPGFAVDRSWIAAAGGVYNLSSNWSGNVVPGAADNGVFNLQTAGYTVTFNSGTTSGGMIVRNDNVTLNLTGFTLVLSNMSPGLTIADQANSLGRLTVANGTLATNNVTLGAHASGTGVSTITTAGRLTVGGILSVGSAGFGSLNVFSGGRLTTNTTRLGNNPASSGSITVNGAGSNWTSSFRTDIGFEGIGFARLVSGGTASFDTLVMGTLAGSDGDLVVDGAGSSLTVVNNFTGGVIGNEGNATLHITDSGVVSGGAFTLGASATGNALVNVQSNGSFNCTGFTTVGSAGHALFNVEAGGRASSNTLGIADFDPGSTGTVFVSGPGSVFNVTGSTRVGGSGAGTLHLSLATFTTGSATIGNSTLSTGRLIVEGSGSFTSSGILNVGFFGQGTTTIINDGDVRCGELRLGFASGSSGVINLSGNGATLISTGAATIGNAGAATVNINTNADASSATLTVGNFNSGNGVINITGTGSSWTAGATTIGFTGSGAVNLTSGGSLSTSSAQIGVSLGSSGAVSVSGNGSRWNASGNVFVGGGTTSAGGSGLIEVGPGGTILANLLFRLYSTGVVNLNGGTLSVGTLENQGGQFNFNSGTLNITSFASGMAIDQFGPLGSILELRQNQNLVVNGTLSVGFNSQLTIDGGRVNAAFVNNTSDIVLRSPTSHLTATVFNNGLIRGQGSIFGNVNNNPNGQIRSSAGETLRILGVLTNNPGARIDVLGGLLQPAGLENAGQVFLDSGLLDASSLINQSTGRISGRGRIVTSGNFSNSGTLNLTAGITDIDGVGSGSFNNNATGRVIVTGNSTTNFFLPVTNASGSEMRVSTGATAVYFEPVSGLDAFTGSGTVIFESTASLGSVNRLGATVIGATAQLSAGHVRENLLEINGQASVLPNGTSAGTSRVQQLHIAGELTPIAQFDLADNDLVIDYTGPSPLITIAAQLKSGYASGAWNGDGISSSAAASGGSFALGFAEASSIFSAFPAVFSGQLVDNTALLIAYTRYGDANLDGVVNLTDFNQLAANFGSTNAMWFSGDFNFDGLVNLTDFNLLAANFGLIASSQGPTPDDWSSLAAMIPEPSLLGLAGVATLAATFRPPRPRLRR